jgi:hypothetical protein
VSREWTSWEGDLILEMFPAERTPEHKKLGDKGFRPRLTIPRHRLASHDRSGGFLESTSEVKMRGGLEVA